MTAITIVYSTFYHILGRLQPLIPHFLTLRFPVLKFNLKKVLNQTAYIKKNTCLVASRSLPVAFNPLNASVALI